MAKFTAAANYASKHTDRQNFMHSSGYAKVQNGTSFGVASSESFAVRQNMEEHRKFIKSYRNSRITNDFYGIQRAKTYRPNMKSKIEKPAQANPVDRAVAKARFSTSGEMRAPQVPNRRAGIG